jgi:hypothetical protein
MGRFCIRPGAGPERENPCLPIRQTTPIRSTRRPLEVRSWRMALVSCEERSLCSAGMVSEDPPRAWVVAREVGFGPWRRANDDGSLSIPRYADHVPAPHEPPDQHGISVPFAQWPLKRSWTNNAPPSASRVEWLPRSRSPLLAICKWGWSLPTSWWRRHVTELARSNSRHRRSLCLRLL